MSLYIKKKKNMSLSKLWSFRGDCIQYSLKVSNSHMGPGKRPSHAQPWSVSDDSLKRFVLHASESCIQDLLSATGDQNRGDGWKILAMGGGVEISRRSNGPLNMLRGRRILRVPLSQFKAVATAIDTAKQWDPNLAEGRHIKDIHENLSIIRLRFSESSKPLFKNREFIVYERRETMDDGTFVVGVASVPNEIAKGLLPKSRGKKLVRGLLLQSGWVIEAMEQSNSCMVTYVVQMDPAGWLPKWVVNRLSMRLVVMVINDLSKLVENSTPQIEDDSDFDPSE
uniref:START domain-containing protein n=1 Tax=Araucaria cunninghamii TaxID=56994 RepID=A0A0D6R6K5_ARACU